MPEGIDQVSGGGGASLPPPIDSGLRGACPQCGAKTLFKGAIKFADSCSACGLDFTPYNVGDGPVVFLTFGLGGLITALALWVEFTFNPPFWVHILLWVPITTALVVALLRIGKSWLLALEYRNRASEARIRKP